MKLIEPHGGVNDTSFFEKTGRASAGDASITDYDDFVARTKEAFAKMTAARTTGADQVARVIYDAATDGTDRLRYLVGDDHRGFIKARHEKSEPEYVNFMRSWFKSKS